MVELQMMKVTEKDAGDENTYMTLIHHSTEMVKEEEEEYSFTYHKSCRNRAEPVLLSPNLLLLYFVSSPFRNFAKNFLLQLV